MDNSRSLNKLLCINVLITSQHADHLHAQHMAPDGRDPATHCADLIRACSGFRKQIPSQRRSDTSAIHKHHTNPSITHTSHAQTAALALEILRQLHYPQTNIKVSLAQKHNSVINDENPIYTASGTTDKNMSVIQRSLPC